MTEYARVDGQEVIERRVITNMPPHKAHLWKPVVYEGSGPLTEVLIEADRVRVVRSEIPLASVKADLKSKVDADAEAVRLKYITPGDGMGMTYREKFEQAELVNELGETAANALTEPEYTAAYPTLAASVVLEAATLWDCAQMVRTAYSQFAMLSNTIEKTRLAGKKAISDASTVQAAQDAYEAITWTV